jgi:hypothetical protein
MKVRTKGGSEGVELDDEGAALEPTPPDKRKELEAEIEVRRNLTVARNVGELMDGRAARRADAGLARGDKWSSGIRLARAAAAPTMVLSGADCAQFRARFAEAGSKLGVIASGMAAAGMLEKSHLAMMKTAWAGCGDALGALATAKAGKWKGLESVQGMGLSVATASLSQICSKVDLRALELKKNSVLGELKSCWVRGEVPAVQLDAIDQTFFEKAWKAIKPDLGNLQTALRPYSDALETMSPPQESRWGSAA